MSELLPCPFCGGRANFYENAIDFVPKWSVGCDDCEANLDVCEDEKLEAAEVWNTRHPAPGPLMVWYGPMPESNGKSNFTAILHKGDLVEGHTIARSEYPDRVRYEADRVRYLIGDLSEYPDILNYDADKHSGYVYPASSTAINSDASMLGMSEAEFKRETAMAAFMSMPVPASAEPDQFMEGYKRDTVNGLIEENAQLREQIARMLVPYWYGGFERQEPNEDGSAWKYPPGTPNARAYEIADKALAALSVAHVSAWQDSAVVPIEPTREMWAAAGDAVVRTGHVHHDVIAGAVWRAMLSAAPSASRNDGKSPS